MAKGWVEKAFCGNMASSFNPFERPSGIRDPYSGEQHEETRHGVAFRALIEEPSV